MRKTTLNKKIFSFNDFLDEYLKNIETSFNFFNVDFNKIVENYENQLKNNLKIFSIDAETKKYLNENFNKNYTENYKLNIKNFTEKNIKKLREKINKYIIEEGLNYKKIADIIQENYSLSQRRSLFIARQETNLCLANYQKER